MAQPTQPVYEVRCQHCDVTFPAGTKRCVHCGEKIGRPSLFRPVTDEDGQPVVQDAEPYDMAEAAEQAEVEEPTRGWRGMRVGITLVWLVLAVAIRMCRGES